ncbi:MAG: hypothetical protein M1826_003783 [Phylliscum demangeonii]|nr:MAG: hypothetical protein M1826_003783 [Phylliscum demangeonii]
MISNSQPLPLQSSSSPVPPLLVELVSSVNGYTIFVTDLTLIWSEKLHRDAVLQRALDEETPIDPSEDGNQFQILLDKIREALKTSLGLLPELHRLQERQLVLRVASSLPPPLRALKWHFRLSPIDSTRLATELWIPLLSQCAHEARRAKS